MNPAVCDGYLHHELLYSSSDELLAAAVPFLRAGLAAGEVAVLVFDEPNKALLADTLGTNGDVLFLDRFDASMRPAKAVATFRRMMHRLLANGAPRVRLVGEVDFGTHPETWVEWIRFESIINVALAPYPLSSVCAYDTRTLPELILTAAKHTHPHRLPPQARIPNSRYVDPVTFLRRSTTVHPHPLETTTPTHERDDIIHPTQIAALRRELSLALTVSGAPEHLWTDFLTAVNEVVTNGLIHGCPPVRIRVWATPRRLHCTVTDQGDGFDDPLAGYQLADYADPYHAGAGLWLTRQLCDLVDALRTPDGFTIRLAAAVPADGMATRLQGVRAHAETTQIRTDEARVRAERLLRSLNQRSR